MWSLMSPDASRDPTNDLALDAEQLRAKYDGLAENSDWGEHPNHPMEEWQTEVHCKNTRVGYWDWVVTKLKLQMTKTMRTPFWRTQRSRKSRSCRRTTREIRVLRLKVTVDRRLGQSSKMEGFCPNGRPTHRTPENLAAIGLDERNGLNAASEN